MVLYRKSMILFVDVNETESFMDFESEKMVRYYFMN